MAPHSVTATESRAPVREGSPLKPTAVVADISTGIRQPTSQSLVNNLVDGGSRSSAAARWSRSKAAARRLMSCRVPAGPPGACKTRAPSRDVWIPIMLLRRQSTIPVLQPQHFMYVYKNKIRPVTVQCMSECRTYNSPTLMRVGLTNIVIKL